MKTHFGPWSTAINTGNNPQLSTFWKRRLTMLNSITRTRPVPASAWFSLIAVGLVICGTPLLHDESVQAQPVAAPKPDSDALKRPTLDELLKVFANLERAYMPYHIHAWQTYRWAKDLTPEQRKRLRIGPGHEAQWRYGQLKDRIWLREETMFNSRLGPTRNITYCDGKRRVHVQYDFKDRPTRVKTDRTRNMLEPLVWSVPVIGVFPLSTFSDGILLSQAVRKAKTKVHLEWDGKDAKLTFVFGPPTLRYRFMLWLSRDHDWHPDKLQVFHRPDDTLFYSEWTVTRFVRKDGVWRVAEGMLNQRVFDPPEQRTKLTPKVAYLSDFDVLEAEYGSSVETDLFRIPIPDDTDKR